MKAQHGPARRRTAPPLARWGPLALIVVLLGAIVAVLVTNPSPTDDATGSDSSVAPGGDAELPPNVMPWSVADAAGVVDDYEWGDGCDVAEGRLKLPLSPPIECFAEYDGDGGGATWTGVTNDTITVVVYVPQENDPVLSFIYDQIDAGDTPTQTFDTYVGYSELMGAYAETYGRTVEMVRYDASGPVNDDVAATTDAETIARDIEPFVVLGGPNLTDAFADTLAANEVMCIACTPGHESQWYAERAPYIWDIQKNTQQSTQMATEYIGKRLAGRPASFGGPEVVDQERRIGLIYLATGPATEQIIEEMQQDLEEDYSTQLVDVASFDSPVGIAGEAREILARFKSEGVTTILYSGDPLAPQALTAAATDQDYYPEWVITGSALVDTTVFARTYDQAQWAHAFGPSNLMARAAPTISGSTFLWNWYFGDEEPPARSNAALALPVVQFLYSVLQGTGTDLTPQTVQDVLFGSDYRPSTVLVPQLSWGERGFWPSVDFAGVDDQTEVWWDGEAVGPNEIGDEGSGMWAYVEGGKRYLPGEWPESDPDVFDPQGAVTLYTDLPPGITVPQYEPLPRS